MPFIADDSSLNTKKEIKVACIKWPKMGLEINQEERLIILFCDVEIEEY